MRGSKEDVPATLESDELIIQEAEWDDMHVGFETYEEEFDIAPLLKGLPDDMCQCAHWGYVITGSIRVRYADGTEEANRAGDLYYWRAGHTGWTEEGVVFIEFSPAEDLAPVLQHIGAQLALVR